MVEFKVKAVPFVVNEEAGSFVVDKEVVEDEAATGSPRLPFVAGQCCIVGGVRLAFVGPQIIFRRPSIECPDGKPSEGGHATPCFEAEIAQLLNLGMIPHDSTRIDDGSNSVSVFEVRSGSTMGDAIALLNKTVARALSEARANNS